MAIFEYVHLVTLDLETVRKPNSRGQMNWNKLAITDLLDCHKSAQLEHKNLAQEKRTKLSSLVHAKFTGLHPYCKLSPAILMTKCYTWKSAIEKGTYAIVDNKPPTAAPAKVKRSASKDLVFRTWSQEMIDNMVKTRKMALVKKKEQEDLGTLGPNNQKILL